MATFTEKSAKAFETTATTVGAYLGWLEGAIAHIEETIDRTPIGIIKRWSAKRCVNKMRKCHKDNEKTFTALIEELGKLSGSLSEAAFISQCDAVRDIVVPLYSQIRVWYKELDSIISLTLISTVPKKGA